MAVTPVLTDRTALANNRIVRLDADEADFETHRSSFDFPDRDAYYRMADLLAEHEARESSARLMILGQQYERDEDFEPTFIASDLAEIAYDLMRALPHTIHNQQETVKTDIMQFGKQIDLSMLNIDGEITLAHGHRGEELAEFETHDGDEVTSPFDVLSRGTVLYRAGTLDDTAQTA